MFSSALLSSLGGFLGGAYIEWAARRPRRRAHYERALARARVAGKPLLVVGDPGGGWTHGDYGYGDVCIDLTGCPDAPPGVATAAVDLSSDRIPLADDSCVAFVCYVLEYVPDIEHAVEEIERVAGRASDTFVLALRADEIAAWMYPGCRWIVSSEDGRISWSPIERRRLIEARSAARG